jgi:hypothetical protein
MINLTTLGLGGLAAALTAGWQQIRNAMGYVSSFVLIKASFDHDLSPVVYAYLKRNYKPLPSGLLNYVSHRVTTMRGRKDAVLVPFRLPAPISVYVGKRAFMVVNADSSQLQIRAIRGLINFDKLTSDALDSWDEHLKLNSKKRDSRFWVRKIIGSEKGMGAALTNYKRKQADSGYIDETSPVGNTVSGSSLLRPDLTLDRSFKYAPDTYAIRDDEDALNGLFFEPRILKYFEQASRWLQMGDWYLDRQIPWRRGWLLHGPGGTGKSSIAKAVAQNLGIPINHFYLATLSDQEFIEHWESMNVPCIALFEDFDNVFHGRENQTEHKSLSFDCVLNQISGVSSLNGVFLIITTNHIEQIDPALGVVKEEGSGISTRPGRVDSVIEVGYINQENRLRMAQKILKDWPDIIEQLMREHADQSVAWTPSQWQEVCIQAALEKLQSDEHLTHVQQQQPVAHKLLVHAE